jgi:hypothetical protein
MPINYYPYKLIIEKGMRYDLNYQDVTGNK